MNATRLPRSGEHAPTTHQPLHQFPSEDIAYGATVIERWRVRLHNRRTIGVAMLSVVALCAFTLVWFRTAAAGAATTNGFLEVVSEPDSANVLIDGQARGVTPLSLTLRPGVHKLEVRQRDRSQQLSVTIAENVSTVHHFTWSDPALNTTRTGSLRVVTDGNRGSVTVDSQPRGATPLTVDSLAAGDHDVVLVQNGNTYRRTIRVEPGAVTSLVIGNRASAGPESGWLTATAAIPLHIVERGTLVGSTESERILMPAGEHMLEFEDEVLGFRTSKKVNVVAGRTQTIAIELPQASISINATPWASVWLDGRALGETPIGNVQTTIGSHTVLLRHPQMGERRVTALVTMKEAARIGVDMRRSQ